MTTTSPADTALAYVAGGCFWGVEHLLLQLPGVLTVDSQYLSVTFVNDDAERATVQTLIQELKRRGYGVVTRIEDATKHAFWPAEAYHQDYYEHGGTLPHCRARVKRFGA